MITIEETKKLNEYFNSLSVEEQRLVLAQDVIAQIKAEKYQACSGAYAIIKQTDENSEGIYSLDLQSNLDKVTCEVCALGGMFISHIKYNNNYTVEEADGVGIATINKILSKYFDLNQLILMEVAFEQWKPIYMLDEDLDIIESGVGHDESLENLNLSAEELQKAYDFTKDIDDSNDILLAIMENVVSNKGVFIP